MTTATDLLGTYLTEGGGGKEVLINEWLDQLSRVSAGYLALSVAGAIDVTLTDTVGGQSSHAVFDFTGVLTASINVIYPAKSRLFVARNSTTGAFTLSLKTPAGTGVIIPQGSAVLCWCDGAEVVRLLDSLVASYTVAGVPAATAGRLGFITDETGGAVLAFADGTNWRRCTDRAVVS